MNGLEAAQERLEMAASKWKKSKEYRGKLDCTLVGTEKELWDAVVNFEKVWSDLLKEKGAIPR